ncbi:MAG: hypothetical protein DRR04_02510 [Gammaproteobacteria bacterium]|nr:MAG: hypothetical protein DRQ97_08885 [Gammaproteobacteria bacterium]RLA61604.1 MAG: hypothetical protein DRR04_02510 [Gammaproteobacteria bacterium]
MRYDFALSLVDYRESFLKVPNTITQGGAQLERIIFPHQSKTGGTSINKALISMVGRDHIFLDTDRRRENEKVRLVQAFNNFVEPYRSYSERADYALILGHFSPFKYRRTFPDAFYMTFYRDPLQQFISLYHFWKRSPVGTNPVQKKLVEENMNLISFGKILLTTGRNKRKAKRFSVDQFDFVGITEEFDSSVHLLRERWLPHLPVVVEPSRVNPDKAVHHRYTLDEETREFLAHRLRRQIRIYEQAVDRFKKDLQGALPARDPA